MRTTRLIIATSCALLLAGCASAAGHKGAEKRYRCPEGREIDTFCSKLTTYARDPDTGHCCRYDSRCSAPTGWKTFGTEADCENADDEDE